MCRKKKIKCDGKMPACSHCINYKTDCVFTQVEKKRNPPKGYLHPASYHPAHCRVNRTNRLSEPSTSKASRIVWVAWRTC